MSLLVVALLVWLAVSVCGTAVMCVVLRAGAIEDEAADAAAGPGDDVEGWL